MGRSALPEAAKRKQVAVRLNPEDRDRIAAIADANKTSVGATVETLALAQMDYIESSSEETRALLAGLADRISELEGLAKGKWHSNLTPWAAVSEMLAHSVDHLRPENPYDDEFVASAFDKVVEARSARHALVIQLQDLGLSVQQEPDRNRLLGAKRRGLFLSSGFRSSREWERAALEAMPEDIKLKAVPIFDLLIEADKEVEVSRDELNQQILPFVEAEQEGRRIAVDSDKRPRNALSGEFLRGGNDGS